MRSVLGMAFPILYSRFLFAYGARGSNAGCCAFDVDGFCQYPDCDVARLRSYMVLSC